MQNNSVITVQALQPVSIPIPAYNQASTGSKEFQDPCTWSMQNNSVFTVQALQPLSICIGIYSQAEKRPQEFQDPCTCSMQNNPVITVQALQPITILILVQSSFNSFSGESRPLTWFTQSNPLRSMKLHRKKTKAHQCF